MGRTLTQQQIKEASLEMESQMELHELQAALAELKENLDYLRSHAKRISFSTYLKVKAAEEAATAAIERIISSRRPNEKQMPKEPKGLVMQSLRIRKGVGRPSKERSRASLRVVYCRCRI